jgi:hypothetical protein
LNDGGPTERADKGRVARFHPIALDTKHGTYENTQAHLWPYAADVIRQEDEVAAYLCKLSGKFCGRGRSTSNTFVKNIDEVMRAGRLVSRKLFKLAFNVSRGSA